MYEVTLEFHAPVNPQVSQSSEESVYFSIYNKVSEIKKSGWSYSLPMFEGIGKQQMYAFCLTFCLT